MEMMKKTIMMMVEQKNNFYFKISHDLEENLKITSKGIIYSGGVSVQEGNYYMNNP